MIGDWATYTLSDFLMFSPDTYWRMVALYVNDLWHLQVTAYALVLGSLWLIYRKHQIRCTCLVLAVIWLVPAYFFFLERYAAIMIAAPYFAGLFTAQAALYFLAAARNTEASDLHWGRGFPLIVFALAIQPFLGFLVAREVPSFEGIALMPDATAVYSLGVLLLIGTRRWLYIVPIVWLAISALTLYAMDDITWFVLMLTVLYSLGIQIIS